VETATGTTLSFPSSELQVDANVDMVVLFEDAAEPAVDAEIAPPVVEDVVVSQPYLSTAPNVLNVPSVPNVPSVSDSLNVPNVTEVSEAANDSNIVNVSNDPNVSSAPNDPNVPNDPNAPNDPGAQTISPDAKARFEEMLARTMRQRPQAAEVEPAKGRDEPQATGDGDADVVAQLEAAALTPSLQFQASAQLGRLLIGRGELRRGVEWLERAVQAPVQIPEHALAVLYEMADALERMGEPARTLEVLLELEAGAGTYRDVRERIARLERTKAGGSEA
jgi:hypothetical protein